MCFLSSTQVLFLCVLHFWSTLRTLPFALHPYHCPTHLSYHWLFTHPLAGNLLDSFQNTLLCKRQVLVPTAIIDHRRTQGIYSYFSVFLFLYYKGQDIWKWCQLLRGKYLLWWLLSCCSKERDEQKHHIILNKNDPATRYIVTGLYKILSFVIVFDYNLSE